MKNFNRIVLAGCLTRDPQLSYTPNQTAVVDFGLAINDSWTAKDGTKKEETCFVDCRMFGKRAEAINQYCKKGDPLLVEGKLTFETWEAQDGSRRSKHKVKVDNFTFLGSGNTGQAKTVQSKIDEGDSIPF